jgi:hypothetical protein
MKTRNCIALIAVAAVALFSTGCFRVSSETRALRDAALEFADADEKIEFGVGFFTVGLARFGTKFVDLPPEAKLVLDAVHGAECSIHELRKKADPVKILARADKVMDKRGCDRIVGVVNRDELVAVYVPRSMTSSRNMQVSVLVLDKKELVCVKASGDLEPLVQIALEQAEQHLPAKAQVASAR